jgi:hypothetical protein
MYNMTRILIIKNLKNMKKLLLMFALLLGVVGAKAEDVLQVKPFTASAGEGQSSEAWFDILMNNTNPVAGLQFEIYMPEGVSIYTNKSGKIPSGAFKLVSDRNEYYDEDEEDDITAQTLSFNALTDEKGVPFVRVLTSSNSNFPYAGNSGAIIRIRYKVDNDLADGVYPISIKNIVFSDPTSNKALEVRVENTTSYVTIGNPSSSAADLPLEGYVASFVMDALAADETVEKLDLSAVTGIGGTLTLKDGVELVPPTEEITIPEVTYTRTTGNTYGTICLPYAVEPDATVKYYAVDGLADGKLSLTELAKVEAGTPAIFEKQSGDGVTATATNVSIPVVDSHVAGADVQLIGTYTNIEVTDPDTYYIKNDKFWSINENFFIKAYRAYLKVTDASVKVIGIGEEATGIDSLDALTSGDYDGIYTPNGVRTDKLQKGVNLIKTGDKVKKVFVK